MPGLLKCNRPICRRRKEKLKVAQFLRLLIAYEIAENREASEAGNIDPEVAALKDQDLKTELSDTTARTRRILNIISERCNAC